MSRLREDNMKKPWKTPELVILFRGRPEESVLVHCKHKNNPPVAPGSYHDDCNTNPACCSACQSNRNSS
jgi:hypothetical protein